MGRVGSRSSTMKLAIRALFPRHMSRTVVQKTTVHLRRNQDLSDSRSSMSGASFLNGGDAFSGSGTFGALMNLNFNLQSLDTNIRCIVRALQRRTGSLCHSNTQKAIDDILGLFRSNGGAASQPAATPAAATLVSLFGQTAAPAPAPAPAAVAAAQSPAPQLWEERTEGLPPTICFHYFGTQVADTKPDF